MGAMMIKLGGAGERFGDYLCLHCTKFPFECGPDADTRHSQFTKSHVTRPSAKISKTKVDDDERVSRSGGCSTFF